MGILKKAVEKFFGNPQTHDYRRRSWGHNCNWHPDPGGGGRTGMMQGWGYGIREGDFILLRVGDPPSRQESRYRVTSIRYETDPSDMWWARVVFAPRTRVGLGE